MGLNRSGNVAAKDRPYDAPVRRRRPGEPQREQKEATRKKLLDAARFIFERYPYSIVSIEMIADQAGVSRTTYYRHFDGKLQIALALFANLAPHFQQRWQEILNNPDPTHEDVRSWIIREVENAEADRALYTMLRQVDATEADSQSHSLRYYEQIMEFMWPEDRLPTDRSIVDLKSRSMLVLLQLDQFQYLFTGRDWSLDRESIIKAMSDLFHEFLLLRKQVLVRKS